MRYRILSYGRFDSMIWYPEMSSMAWSGGDYELNSEGVLWTPTTHGKLTFLCELIHPAAPRLTYFFFFLRCLTILWSK